MPWVKEKVNTHVDYDLFNLDFSKIKIMYVWPGKTEEDLWNLSIIYFGDESGYSIYQGTQVACMRLRDKLAENLNPIELEAWS